MSHVPPYLGTNNKLMEALQDLATKDTAEYFYNLEQQPEFIPNEIIRSPFSPRAVDREIVTFRKLDDSKEELRKLAAEQIETDGRTGFVAEFGCNKGASFIPLCARFPDQKVFGFDGFDGLPGDKWEGNLVHKGAFKHEGKCPFVIPKNGVITEGWFNDTLPAFDFGHGTAAFLHIDCDVYSSTVTILKEMEPYIAKGTVIVFDDYCNHTNWRQGEWKAWQEYCRRTGTRYEYLYVAGMSTAVKIIRDSAYGSNRAGNADRRIVPVK